MKKINIIPLIIIVIFFITSCSKKEVIQTYFYTKNNSPRNQLSLFIDGVQIGLLPCLGNNPTFDLISSKGLISIMKNGDHYIYAKDTTGSIVSSMTINISNYKTYSKTIQGSSSTAFSAFFTKHLIIELSH